MKTLHRVRHAKAHPGNPALPDRGDPGAASIGGRWLRA